MIKLDDHFYLKNDSTSWTLVYEKEGEVNNKTGKPKITRRTWHTGTVDQALKRYIDESLKPCQSVLAMLTTLNRCMKKLES